MDGAPHLNPIIIGRAFPHYAFPSLRFVVKHRYLNCLYTFDVADFRRQYQTLLFVILRHVLLNNCQK